MTCYHCHTQFCDGASTAEEMVLAAIKAGFPALGFSSHAPVPFPAFWTMPASKAKAYTSELFRLQEHYKDKIQIYRGLEVDYIKNETNAKSQHILDFYSDYLVGSIHFMGQLVLDGERWSIDGSNEEFKYGLDHLYGGDIKRLVRDFTQQSVDMMELGGFDIVGHIDKIYQHGKAYFSLDEKWYRNEVMTLLECAKAHDYILEINTKHYHVHGIFFPHQDFIKDIKRLNIPVQINSDCHQKEMMTAAYDIAYQALHAAGIKSEYVLLDGKWQDVAIK